MVNWTVHSWNGLSYCKFVTEKNWKNFQLKSLEQSTIDWSSCAHIEGILDDETTWALCPRYDTHVCDVESSDNDWRQDNTAKIMVGVAYIIISDSVDGDTETVIRLQPAGMDERISLEVEKPIYLPSSKREKRNKSSPFLCQRFVTLGRAFSIPTSTGPALNFSFSSLSNYICTEEHISE